MNGYKTEWNSTAWRLLYRDAISSLCCDMFPPLPMVDRWLDGDDEELQQWAVSHATHTWMTGISILEAAHMLVEEAYNNANIDGYGNIL